MRYLSNVATLRYDEGKCTGCSRCVEVCAHGVFAMNARRATIIDRDMCMECGACARNCASGAITVNQGVGCATALINSAIRGGEPDCGCATGGSGQSSCC